MQMEKHMNNVSFENIQLTDGFWLDRYKLNAKVSVDSIKKRFEETNRFNSVRFLSEKLGFKPHIFYDSDVAKWIEAVSFLISKDKKSYKRHERYVDELIDCIEKFRMPNGYFNSYFQTQEKENIFKRRSDHELYCAGHLLEAAIAYEKATGKSKFLNLMIDYVDYIAKVFMEEKSSDFTTPGHEELELALLKLYNYKKDERFLKLAEFFLNNRGIVDDYPICDAFNLKYDQNDVAVRDIKYAVGHSVRAVYLYTAMADYTKITGDKKMQKACERVLEDVIKKMYVTGGIGSARIGECFTTKYDLPNLYAYSESCAAIGLVFFLLKMQNLKIDSKYGDIIERVLYNGFLSTVSLNGKEFFYENPLEVCLKEIDKEECIISEKRTKLPQHRRSEVFGCSCCPPNIARMFASIADVIYTEDANTLYVNQYISNKYNGVEITTCYPTDGVINVSGVGVNYKKVALRIPAWCKNYGFKCEGAKVYQEKNGYVVLTVEKDFQITLTLEITPVFYKSDYRVRDNAGKVCLMRGPVVYCLESEDNGTDLYAVCVDTDCKVEFGKDEGLNVDVLSCKGYRDVGEVEGENSIYKVYEEELLPVDLKFIPYYAFANRKPSDMTVWIRRK